MEDQHRKLKAGDVLYKVLRGTCLRKLVIDKVTEKTAYSGNTPIHITPDEYGCYKRIGLNYYDKAIFILETPEIKKQYARRHRKGRTHKKR